MILLLLYLYSENQTYSEATQTPPSPKPKPHSHHCHRTDFLLLVAAYHHFPVAFIGIQDYSSPLALA